MVARFTPSCHQHAERFLRTPGSSVELRVIHSDKPVTIRPGVNRALRSQEQLALKEEGGIPKTLNRCNAAAEGNAEGVNRGRRGGE